MTIVKDALIQEITEKAATSKELFDTIKNSKTKIKAKTYKKRLKANNEILASLIISLDKLNNSQYNDHNNKNNNGIDDSGQTQQSK